MTKKVKRKEVKQFFFKNIYYKFKSRIKKVVFKVKS